MANASSSIEIKAPIKTVFDVVTDFEAYPEFLPETKAVEVQSSNGKSAKVTFTIQIIKKISYTLDIKLKAPKEMSWDLIKGDMMKSNQGRWLLKEKGKGITEATYEIDMRFGLMVPKSISDMLIGSNLPTMMKHFKERAESLA